MNYYFECWKKKGTLIAMNDQLNMLDRVNSERSATPSLMCIESQSVKLSPMIYEDRGIDNNKKINGRKRQLLVDTGGRLWRVVVHAANGHDGPGGSPLLKDLKAFDKYLEKILGDGVYVGVFAQKAAEHGLVFERTSRPESASGFVHIAKRWVVERTIAWSNFFRRIVKDYEYTVQSSATWMILANMTIMLQRIPIRAK